MEWNQLKVFCNNCKAVLDVRREKAGQPMQCTSCSEFFIAPKVRFAANVVINDFVLQEEIGVGGCGTVYLAYQISLDRHCAIKILHNYSEGQQDYYDELINEGRIAGRLNHQNIVQCYAIGEEEEIFYYAMEYVDGKSLKELLGEKWALPLSRSLNLALQVIDALEYAWQKQRLVHRDIKPDNIMITAEMDIKVADMGIALPAHATASDGDKIKGSPPYISPEQILNEPQDFRSDIYSLGAVLYQCVTGHFPLPASDAKEFFMRHLHDEPDPPLFHNPDLPPELSSILLKMLHKDPDYRYQNYDNLRRSLVAIQQEHCYDTTTVSHKAQEIRDEQTRFQKKKSFQKKSLTLAAILLLSSVSAAITFKVTSKPQKLEAKVTEETATVLETDSKTSSGKEELSPAPSEINEVIELSPEKVDDKILLRIVAALPDPEGYDSGKEWITLRNDGQNKVSLKDWQLKEKDGETLPLSGVIEAQQEFKVLLPKKSITLNNLGDVVTLYNPAQEKVDQWDYNNLTISRGVPLRR